MTIDVHELRKIDYTGDTKTMWDPAKPDEVANARKTFRELREKGYRAHKVGKDGSEGEIIHEFDPQAGAIIMSAPLVGG